MPLSKVFECITEDTATFISQDSSNIIGVFPDPTPNAGFPEE